MTNWSKALVALTVLSIMALGAMLEVLDWVPYGMLSGVNALYAGVVPEVIYLAIVGIPVARDEACSALLF